MDLLKQAQKPQSVSEFYKNNLKNILNYAMRERNNYRLYLLAGFCYKKTGNYEKAIIYFTKAFKQNPECFEAFYECGLCAAKLKDTCLSVNSFIKAIKLNPNHPYAILNLGLAHEMCDEPDMAELIYSRLNDTNPDFIEGFIKKSELLMSSERYDDVIELLTGLLSEDISDGRIFELLGTCYRKTGKITHARRALRKAATLTANVNVYKSAKRSLKMLSALNQTKNLKLCSAK
ncbi:tetratricopeptide repeat protein [bacterium]|nr:tetratricopeptide repeat protein [bacterium]